MPLRPEHASTVKIKGFQGLSMGLDWKKRMASVIFTGGCNFRCPYCHNRDLVVNNDRLEDLSYEDGVKPELLKYKHWTDSVVITGGEPTIHAGLPALVRDLKESGFNVKLDTNGSNPYALKYLTSKGLLDYIAMDIKDMPDDYDRYTRGAIPAKTILESINHIISCGVDHEFRTTILPRFHEEKDIAAISRYLRAAGAMAYFLQNFRAVNTLDPALMDKASFPSETFDILRLRYAYADGAGAGTGIDTEREGQDIKYAAVVRGCGG